MQTANLWDKLSVFRNKIIIMTMIGWMVSSDGYAQLFRWARQNNPHYDSRSWSYGFMIGLHTSSYQVKYSNQFVTPKYDTVHSVVPQFLPGFSLGFLINYRLNDYWDLRLMPKAGFYSHILHYYFTNAPPQTQLVETTLYEFPLLIKYKSERRGNVRMYMVAGFTPAFEASGKNDTGGAASGIGIRKQNFSIDTGMGFDFYFPLFKFSTELRFTKGIANMLGSAPGPFHDPLSRLNTETIGVYFIFQ